MAYQVTALTPMLPEADPTDFEFQYFSFLVTKGGDDPATKIYLQALEGTTDVLDNVQYFIPGIGWENIQINQLRTMVVEFAEGKNTAQLQLRIGTDTFVEEDEEFGVQIVGGEVAGQPFNVQGGSAVLVTVQNDDSNAGNAATINALSQHYKDLYNSLPDFGQEVAGGDGFLNEVDAAADKLLQQQQTASHFINDSQDSLVPALIVSDFVFGSTPSAERLEALAAFAENQANSPGYQATANPVLGAFEALGLGFSETAEFRNRAGEASQPDFIMDTYADVFGRAASVAQVQHFDAQIDYFASLYTSVGINAETAEIRAKGAVAGQMLGYAAAEEGNPYAEGAQAFVIDLYFGDPSFGAPLLGYEPDRDTTLLL